MPRLDRQKFVDRLSFHPAFELDPRLLTDPMVAVPGPTARLKREGEWQLAKRLARRDVVCLQLARLQPGDSGYETKVIVVPALPVAEHQPRADVALRAGLGVSRNLCIKVGHGRFQTAANPSVKCHVVERAVGLRRVVRSWRDDVHLLRQPALNRLYDLGIDTELKDSCRRASRGPVLLLGP